MLRVCAALTVILSGLGFRAQAAWDVPFNGDPIVEIFRKQQTGVAYTVYAAATEPGNGPLWFGTDHGLLVFDGLKWTHHPDTGSATALAFTPDGHQLIFGSWCDLGWIDFSPDGRPRVHSLREHLPFPATELQAVRACRASPNGFFYVADNCVLRWDGAKLDVWRYPGKQRLFPIEFEGALWFHDPQSGLYSIGPNGPERMFTDGLPRDTGLFWLGRKDGQLIGISNHGCWTLEPRPRCLSPRELNEFTAQYSVIGVVELARGFRSVATLTGGIAIVDSDFKIVRQIPSTGDLQGSLYGQFRGRENDLWLLGEDRLLRLESTGATTRIRLDDDPRPKFTRFISVAPDHSLWVGTENRLYHLQRAENGRLGAAAETSVRQLYTVLAEENRTWLAGFGGVILRENGRDEKRFDGNGRHAFGMVRLGQTDRWVASLNGGWMDISRSAPGQWSSEVRLNLPFFESAALDVDGALWTASPAEPPKKWIVQPDGFTPVPLPPPLTAAEAAPSIVVARAHDAIVVAGNRVYRTRGAAPPLLLCKLPAHAVAGAVSTDQQRLYLALNHGTTAPAGYQDSISVLELADNGRDAQLRHLVVPQLHTAGAINRLAINRTAGADLLWIGGSDALLQTRPAELPEWSPPAPPMITAGASGRTHTTLDYSESLRLRVTSPEITLRPALRYQTQFGPDGGYWSAPGDITSFEFSNLREGRYSFAVRAVNPIGQVSAPSYYSFVILPPWYRATGAYVGYAALASLGLFGALRYRERRIRARNLELQHLVDERTAELVKANAAKDDFLASMSHEIRNPMNGVVGLSAAIDISHLDEEGRYRFGLLRHCATHLASLLEDILDFSKLQAGTIELDPQPFAPAELLDAVSAITSPVSAAAGVKVEFALGPSVPPRLIGDARRIRQVLLNYVSNAIKYAPQGDIDVTVWARTVGESNAVVTFAVSDAGPGIPTEEQERIFEKFERGAGARSNRIPGTGMGLAVCRRLATKMGGTAWVESSPGEGATFYLSVELPIAAPVTLDTATQTVADLPKLALIVDDEDYNLVTLATMLERRGFQVLRAANGDAALAALAQHPDVVFLDYDMPDITGPALARRIRQTVQQRPPLIIATTAYSTVEKRRECLAAGMDGFLSKPVGEERLGTALLEAIQTRSPGDARHFVLPSRDSFDPLENLQTLARQHTQTLEAELAEFSASAQGEFEELHAGLAASDRTRSARAAHKLAGRFGFLHAAAIMKRALHLERLCQQGDWTAARLLATELTQDWTALHDTLARLNCESA